VCFVLPEEREFEDDRRRCIDSGVTDDMATLEVETLNIIEAHLENALPNAFEDPVVAFMPLKTCYIHLYKIR
jgi:hypothetical protein